ncbi:MAG: hypothetical protein J0L64_18925 [Acidobacteria bacterium]|nr:hypothetical protein [Acidobacteriota bacterium]
MTNEHRYSLFGYRFSFRTNVARAAELVAELYAGSEDTSAGSPENHYSLLRQREQDGASCWRIEVPGTPPSDKRSLGDALSAVEASITADLARHPHGLHVVHGGVIYGPRGDLLLSGNSGAGKTTLSLALAARGLCVGGDDMAVLDPASGSLRPHPRCFHIDEHSARLLAGLGLRLPEDLMDDQFVTPRRLGLTAPRPARLRFVFFLEPERLPAPRILSQSQAQAASQLLLQTGRGQFADGEGVRAIAALTAGARCFQLWSGELAATADAVLRLVEA